MSLQPFPLASMAVLACVGIAGCARSAYEHQDHDPGATATQQSKSLPADTVLPASGVAAAARLTRSTRHGEWVMVAAGQDSVRAWLVYPERRTKAPVVVVIHEIFGLTPWVRAVADQLAASGFIAIAPDLLTGKIPAGLPDSAMSKMARDSIRTLSPDDIHRHLDAVAAHAMALPAAQAKYGVVGFCWGGATAFAHAVRSQKLGAAVVFYGSSPPPTELAAVRAPVLGLYADNDMRVNATVPAADSTMRALGKTFVTKTFTGAGHGFLRSQEERDGANLTASRAAWPLTIEWFRKYLDS